MQLIKVPGRKAHYNGEGNWNPDKLLSLDKSTYIQTCPNPVAFRTAKTLLSAVGLIKQPREGAKDKCLLNTSLLLKVLFWDLKLGPARLVCLLNRCGFCTYIFMILLKTLYKNSVRIIDEIYFAKAVLTSNHRTLLFKT